MQNGRGKPLPYGSHHRPRYLTVGNAVPGVPSGSCLREARNAEDSVPYRAPRGIPRVFPRHSPWDAMYTRRPAGPDDIKTAPGTKPGAMEAGQY